MEMVRREKTDLPVEAAPKRLLLIGGGGHCRSVIDCVRSAGEYTAYGIVDRIGTPPVMGISVVGTDDDLPWLYGSGWTHAFIAVGSDVPAERRSQLCQLARGAGFLIPEIIDLSAIRAEEVSLGEGVFVGKRAVINAGSRIESCAIINTGAIVEHECEIGSFTHIAVGAILCGRVTVGSHTHIGAGTVIRQRIRIGSHCMVGAGSVVVSDIPDGVLAYGNPCRVIGPWESAKK